MLVPRTPTVRIRCRIELNIHGISTCLLRHGNGGRRRMQRMGTLGGQGCSRRPEILVQVHGHLDGPTRSSSPSPTRNLHSVSFWHCSIRPPLPGLVIHDKTWHVSTKTAVLLTLGMTVLRTVHTENELRPSLETPQDPGSGAELAVLAHVRSTGTEYAAHMVGSIVHLSLSSLSGSRHKTRMTHE